MGAETMGMNGKDPCRVITDEFLRGLFPPQRADEFFDALYGGAEAGAFDIGLACRGFDPKKDVLTIEFRLTERPGKCMACSLTYGLPPVFRRHPVIGMEGIVESIGRRLAADWTVGGWEIEATQTATQTVNVIPVRIRLARRVR